MPNPSDQAAATTAGKSRGGYTLWQYSAGTWVLKKEACDEGYACGVAPREPGSYEGEVRKTNCVPVEAQISAAR